jgi:hypothetical protein
LVSMARDDQKNQANEPDRANRRRPFPFRRRVGERGAAGSTAAVAHLECLPTLRP